MTSEKPFQLWSTTQPVSFEPDEKGDYLSEEVLYAYGSHFIDHFDKEFASHWAVAKKAAETHVLDHPLMIRAEVQKDMELPASLIITLEAVTDNVMNEEDAREFMTQEFQRIWNKSSACVERAGQMFGKLLDGIMTEVYGD